jgi:ATP-dependent helicase HepA
MPEFITGQRWISQAEPQLGLGTIKTIEHRTINVQFIAADVFRTYAIQTAPLSRIILQVGDQLQTDENSSHEITAVTEKNGLIHYQFSDKQGQSVEISEINLSHTIQFNRPSEKLFSGQIDHHQAFALRYSTQHQSSLLLNSDVSGLVGSRVELLPHQLFIAHEVANRFAPRVLLADEVGLGKTIEAGLIIHHQLHTELAERILIVVPESLVHQWLVEMLRRFNRLFSVFDEARCQIAQTSTGIDNPFQTQQLILCSIEFLSHSSTRFFQAASAGWDLLVVDEAHHLQWSEGNVSREYEVIDTLASVTPGVLLLTATPEQLGKTSHFARLHLLDPNRFSSFSGFIEEEKGYEPVAKILQSLISDSDITQALQSLSSFDDFVDDQQLILNLKNEDPQTISYQIARQHLIEHLLDRHGTGRILFRNTRMAIKGFPVRVLHSYPLTLPSDLYPSDQSIAIETLLTPEKWLINSDEESKQWLSLDPRFNWLKDKIQQLKPAKILIITQHQQTVVELAAELKIRTGIHAAIFHEGMSLIERDRFAAYFADQDEGSQILICSEIGSEGRNFQFAHEMILFDLPLNPDLLEQRIGRLDRIGQKQTINIHVPYIQNTAQSALFHWYHFGLNAFEKVCPVAQHVYFNVKEDLTEAMISCPENFDQLISQTQTCKNNAIEILERGRNRLLEYQSCRIDIAANIISQIDKTDQSHENADVILSLLDGIGVQIEEQSWQSYIIKPGNQMSGALPGLQTDGMTITFDRQKALHNENLHFFTWEHPIVANAMEIVLSQEKGNTCLVAIEHPAFSPGELLVECLFVLASQSTSGFLAHKYLPVTNINVLINEKGQDQQHKISHDDINHCLIDVNEETAKAIIEAKQNELKYILSTSEESARQQMPSLLKNVWESGQTRLDEEIKRLTALSLINPNVRQEEIDFFQLQLDVLKKSIASIKPRLDAVRVIVTT